MIRICHRHRIAERAVDVTSGVPETAPVAVLSVNPVGKVGEMLNAKGAVPPPPWIGVKGATPKFFVKKAWEICCVAVTAALTVRLKLLLAVAVLASVTVTV